MKKTANYILIIFLALLLIIGFLVNKENSNSKKNEISNFAKQLKIRNQQIAKIQKNLLRNKNNINNFINSKNIIF